MATSDKILEITDANFDAEVLGASTPFLLDLWAERCMPCKALTPVIQELAGAYAGKVSFGKLDVDNNPKVPTQFHVLSIPTLLLFREGKVLGQLTGAHPKNRIEELIKKGL